MGDKGGRCVGLTNIAPSCAECLETWVTQTPETLWACNWPVQGLFYLLLITAAYKVKVRDMEFT
jgi:hypothetical protein